ncbi:UNVERIFIED_CONTAM: hypothetical protein FKN15_031841 [Acipenser sinensis]
MTLCLARPLRSTAPPTASDPPPSGPQLLPLRVARPLVVVAAVLSERGLVDEALPAHRAAEGAGLALGGARQDLGRAGGVLASHVTRLHTQITERDATVQALEWG